MCWLVSHAASPNKVWVCWLDVALHLRSKEIEHAGQRPVIVSDTLCLLARPCTRAAVRVFDVRTLEKHIGSPRNLHVFGRLGIYCYTDSRGGRGMCLKMIEVMTILRSSRAAA
jgi:hypothetical protein